ncbi:hypothetical protein R1flu_000730 [Riccia fluitans]|uniref:Uncharacterized protein n=1 Tax=Riccia fluitans TaxID=41844 RepID=A0ABD1Y1Q0_9MARC
MWEELKTKLQKIILDYSLDSVEKFEGEELKRLRAEYDADGKRMAHSNKDLVIQRAELQGGLAEVKTQWSGIVNMILEDVQVSVQGILSQKSRVGNSKK